MLARIMVAIGLLGGELVQSRRTLVREELNYRLVTGAVDA